ncbi:MAG: amidohydrolase family protein [Firmicutes bacterium]|nr:amidohydrolase family protein [Bacillota bacterium]
MPYQGIPIIDFHAHLPAVWGGGQGQASQAFQANQGVREELRNRWRRRHGFPDPENPPAPPEIQIERWSAEVDRHGLEKVIFVTGGGNETLAGVLRGREDRFHGMAHHDPSRPEALAELKRAVEEFGFVGYKMLGPRVSIPLDDQRLEPIWGFLEEKGLYVLIHMGFIGRASGLHNMSNLNPLVLHNVAAAHPGLPIVIPHFGCGFWEDLLRLCWACPNVHLDTSGSNEWMDWSAVPLSLRDLFRKAYETVGPDRIIFGTDSSWFPRGFSFSYLQEQFGACVSVGMKDEDLAAVFAGNARRMLKAPPA